MMNLAVGSSSRRCATVLTGVCASLLCAATFAASAHASSVTNWAATGSTPSGIAVDSAGNIYTTNSGSNNVSKITPSSYPAPPARPAAPSAVLGSAGSRAVTVTVAANPLSAASGAPSSYTVTAVQDASKHCTVSFLQSSCVVSGLTLGTAYTFTSKAKLATWQTAASAPSEAVTPTSVPDAPTALSATAGNASASIAFTPGASNGAAITNYEYKLDDGAWTALSPSVTSSPIAIASLTNGVTYAIRLRALNTAGAGGPSDAVSVTPAAPTPTPSNKFVLLPVASNSLTLQSVIVVSSPGTVTQHGTFNYSSGARSARRLTACTGSKKLTKAGRYKLTCKLTSAARSARRRGSIRVRLTTTFTPTGGTARAVTRNVTLKKTSSGVTG